MKTIIFICLTFCLACSIPLKQPDMEKIPVPKKTEKKYSKKTLYMANELLNQTETETKTETEKKINQPYFCAYNLKSKNDFKAYSIFKRVLNVADKRSNRFPKFIISEKPGVWAKSQEDGSVIVSRSAIEFCFQTLENDIGESCLAFVLGHEMAHLANDNFWKMPSDDHSFCDIEYKADYDGLIYTTMAGYDPLAIANTSFIEKWVKQTYDNPKKDRSHPLPNKREKQLSDLCTNMQRHIILFDIGTRLYLIERYDDAIDFFESFKQKFPGREVSNNIGLSYYQKAFKILAECDPEKAFRFKLSTAIDTDSNARAFISKRNCNEYTFRHFIEESIRNFKDAIRKDPFYFNAQLNLSSAYILSGKCSHYKEANNLLEEINQFINNQSLKMADKHINLFKNNLAIVRYLCGKCDPFMDESKTKLSAINILMNIEKKANSNPLNASFYNIGKIFWEEEKIDKANHYWSKYFNNDQFSAHIQKTLFSSVDIIEDNALGIDFSKLILPDDLISTINDNKLMLEKSLDQIIDLTEENVSDLNELGIQKSVANYYSNHDYKILFLDNIPIYIEVKLKKKEIIDQPNKIELIHNVSTREGYDIYKHSTDQMKIFLNSNNNIIDSIIISN